MENIPDGGKTEKATPKRRQDERKKGNIFQSRDVTSAFGFLGMILFVKMAAPYFLSYLEKFLKGYLGGFSQANGLSQTQGAVLLSDFSTTILLLSLPCLLAAALIGFVLDAAQTRFIFTAEKLKFDISKINFFTGLKRLFNMRVFVELLKSAFKITIVAYVLYTEIKNRMPHFMRLQDKEISEAFFWTCDTVLNIAIKITLIMAAFAVLDYLYQWWDYERQIMMSKQAIKDEYKQTEGDPQIKRRIRDQQKRMSMMRIMQKVPLSDVVIRNPTHFAVAIQYDPKKDRAPIVLVKGQDYLALKIVDAAEKNNVQITENPPLARGLYATVEMGQEIPEEYYQAVAEVLAFVYNLKREKKRV